jgi:adenylate kinase
LVLLGPPGAGKGTQAERIEKDYNIPRISTGDILREELEKKTRLGERVRKFVEAGLLVPDDIMLDIIKKRLTRDDTANGFILDGFPRTVNQAKGLDRISSIDMVIYFALDEEIAVERISKRRVCPECFRVYNLVTNPPKREGRCDGCGEKLILRNDDREETVRERFRIYEKSTLPLKNFYFKKDILFELNAGESVKKVYNKVKGLLTKYAA